MGSLETSLVKILKQRIARITRMGSFGTSLGLILSPRIARITRMGSFGTSLVKILKLHIARIARMGSFGNEHGVNSMATYRTYNTYRLVGDELGSKF